MNSEGLRGLLCAALPQAPPPGACERIAAAIAAPRSPPARRHARRTALVLAGAACALLLGLSSARRAALVTPIGKVERVGASAGDALRLTDGSRISLGAGSDARILGDGPDGVIVALEAGTLLAVVAPQPAERRFAVIAGEVTVEVVGTVFSVERAGRGARLAVHAGAVRVRHPGGEERIEAPGRWPEPSRQPMQPPPLAPTIAEPPPAASNVRHGSRRRAAATPPPVGALSPYEAARRLERAGALEEAAAAFAAIARSGGPYAEDGLYAAARLARRRGLDREAERLLEDYLASHPAGRYARAAAAGVIDLALARGDRAAAARRARWFLERHPDDPRAAELRALATAVDD